MQAKATSVTLYTFVQENMTVYAMWTAKVFPTSLPSVTEF